MGIHPCIRFIEQMKFKKLLKFRPHVTFCDRFPMNLMEHVAVAVAVAAAVVVSISHPILSTTSNEGK